MTSFPPCLRNAPRPASHAPPRGVLAAWRARLTAPAILGAVLAAGLTAPIGAQTEPLPLLETNTTVGLDSTGQPQDFEIPESVGSIVLYCKGGNGGNAKTDNGCISYGGFGASVSGHFFVGTEDGELAPGGTLRFLVAEHGLQGYQTGATSAGGAGGGACAVLYLPPDADPSYVDDWEILLVGGGGGGAHQGVVPILGICVDGQEGIDGSTTTSGFAGSNWTSGGTNGGNGSNGTAAQGGHGINCGAGVSGCTGGAHELPGAAGGYGFAGGSGGIQNGGGGGGGYSGGGGSDVGHAGGGGGSYIRDDFVQYPKFLSPGVDVIGGAEIPLAYYVTYPNPDSCDDALPLLPGGWVDTTDMMFFEYLPQDGAMEWWYRVDGDECTETRSIAWQVTNSPDMIVTTYPDGCDGDIGVQETGTSGTFVVPAGSDFRVSFRETWIPSSGRGYALFLEPDDVVAGPPGNDEAWGAFSIGSGMSLAAPTFTAIPNCATVGPIDPFLESACEPANGMVTQDVWFTYTNNEVYPTTLDLGWNTEPIITSVAVHPPGPGAAVACDSSNFGGPGALSITLAAGETKLIRVMQESTSPAGAIEISAEVSAYDPWTDLGSGLAGSSGEPALTGTGILVPGSLMTLSLDAAAPLATARLILGLTQISAPFKQGVLVPAPDVILPLLTDASGGIDIPMFWPLGLPGGIDFYWQYWIVDPTGPAGFTASNALRATPPPP